MKKIQSKIKALECKQDIPHYKSMGVFSNSAVRGRILPNFELVQDIMVVLHTCKNDEDPIKNEEARVLTRLYVVFSDAQGQLTPKSAAEFCRNSNSSKLL